MDQETAYCYLNCTASANCCGTCGECPACCKDCPTDYSTFSDTAYYKDGSFYRNQITTASFKILRDFSDTSNAYKTSGFGTSTYKSKNSACSSNKSYSNFTVFEDGDSTYSSYVCGGTECYNCGCDDNDDCWTVASRCGPDCCGTGSASCDSCIDDSCTGFNFGCNGLECICTPEDECEGIYETEYSTKISFEDTVQLYNSKGEVVDPSFIGASYDPCNPCATWSAACHFFHP